MANQRNYQRELDHILDQIEQQKTVPTLLLHSCCAPCSSYVLEYLSRLFEITVFYYNPNIVSLEEYEKRQKEQQRLINQMETVHPIHFLTGDYDPDCFYQTVKGMEQEPEGGKRCYACYQLRLKEAAKAAEKGGFDFFTTTLSISPLKRADWLNEIGEQLAATYAVTYLVSDFKKKGGYQRSVQLSREYDLYRQNYCGCVFSLRDMQESKKGIAFGQE